MHYFKFNVATWVQSTRGLLPEDEGIYIRLCLHYYDTETPFPVDLRRTLRRLQLLPFEAQVADILDEFFTLTDKGWFHKRISNEIKYFHQTSKKNKANGMKGGRPKRDKPLSVTQDKPSGLPVGTESDSFGNLNYELRTKNQKNTSKAEKPPAFLDQDMDLARLIFKQIKQNNPKAKEPKLDSWAKVIRLTRERDKKTIEEISALFTWANQHDFWHTNILSPATLRRQWDTLWIQRKSQANGGGRKLRLPADDNALVEFAAKNHLPGTRAGENYWEYRNRLNAAIETKTKD